MNLLENTNKRFTNTNVVCVLLKLNVIKKYISISLSHIAFFIQADI